MNTFERFSEKHLANTEAQTNPKTLNDEDYNLENDIEEVSEETISQLKSIVNIAPILELTIIESLYFQQGYTIKINSLGLVGESLRDIKDGNTFFGYIENENENNFNNDNSYEKGKGIDFVVKPRENSDENQNIEGRYFRIRFDANNMKYYIKDLGCGYGTFKKISKETKLKDSYLVNIGNSYIVFTFGIDEYDLDGNNIADADKILNIKVFSEIPKAEPYFFNPQQFTKIFIGRDISCNIIVDDTLLSRVHCTIEYKQDGCWVISDGKIDDDLSQSRPSTNGTWLYLIEETEIEEGMIFKSNQNVYECHIIKQSQ